MAEPVGDGSDVDAGGGTEEAVTMDEVLVAGTDVNGDNVTGDAGGEGDLAESDPSRARSVVESMCQQLLANTVIESYQIEVKG